MCATAASGLISSQTSVRPSAAHLVDPAQRGRAGQDVLRPGVPVGGQGTHGDRRDIRLVQQGHRGGTVRAAHYIACADLRCPFECVRGETAGAKEGPFQGGFGDRLLDDGVCPADRMVLLPTRHSAEAIRPPPIGPTTTSATDLIAISATSKSAAIAMTRRGTTWLAVPSELQDNGFGDVDDHRCRCAT